MKKKIFAFLLILISIISVISLYIYLNYPLKVMSQTEKEAAIAKILGRKPNLTDNAPAGDVKYSGKYVSFKYPAGATIRKQLLNGQEVPYTGLERLIFKIENTKLTFYMEVIEAPANVTSINDYPSVKLRQIQSNVYSQSDVFVENVKGLLFEKQTTNSFETTGYFLLNDKIYSFSVQGPDPKAIKELLNKIISSAKFL